MVARALFVCLGATISTLAIQDETALLRDVDAANRALSNATAHEIISWASARFGSELAVSTSFGANAAAMLDVAQAAAPNIPVIWVDTGYLPAETHTFAEDLTRRLGLNLHKYTPKVSTKQMEARYGKLWEMESAQASKLYDMLRKVEPMMRSMREMNVTAVIAGVQRDQIPLGRQVQTVTLQSNIFKICPFLGWEQSDVDAYLRTHDLPRHPLTGLYTTIGDLHSMRPVPPRPPAQNKETRVKAHEAIVLDDVLSCLAVQLAVVLGGLIVLVSSQPERRRKKALKAPRMSAVHTGSFSLPAAAATHETNYSTVSGATGAMLLKELQTSLNEGAPSGSDVSASSARDGPSSPLACKDFWHGTNTSNSLAPPAEKPRPNRRHSLHPLPSQNDGQLNAYLNSFTVSGVGGLQLAQELQRALQRREACTNWQP